MQEHRSMATSKQRSRALHLNNNNKKKHATFCRTKRNGAITTSIIGPDKTVRWRRRSSDARGVAARTGRRRAPRHRHSRHTRDHHTVNTRTTLTAEQTLIRNEIKLNFSNYWNRGDSRTTTYDSWLSLNMSLGFYEFHQTNKPLNRFVVIPHIKIR